MVDWMNGKNVAHEYGHLGVQVKLRLCQFRLRWIADLNLA